MTLISGGSRARLSHRLLLPQQYLVLVKEGLAGLKVYKPNFSCSFLLHPFISKQAVLNMPSLLLTAEEWVDRAVGLYLLPQWEQP
jgi:hypothetical protein